MSPPNPQVQMILDETQRHHSPDLHCLGSPHLHIFKESFLKQVPKISSRANFSPAHAPLRKWPFLRDVKTATLSSCPLLSSFPRSSSKTAHAPRFQKVAILAQAHPPLQVPFLHCIYYMLNAKTDTFNLGRPQFAAPFLVLFCAIGTSTYQKEQRMPAVNQRNKHTIIMGSMKTTELQSFALSRFPQLYASTSTKLTCHKSFPHSPHSTSLIEAGSLQSAGHSFKHDSDV